MPTTHRRVHSSTWRGKPSTRVTTTARSARSSKRTKLSGRDTILYNIGLALHRRYSLQKSPDDLRRAVATYREYLDKVPKGKKRNVAVTALGQLEPELAKLEAKSKAPGEELYGDDPDQATAAKKKQPAIRTGLMISCATDGAIIELDGRQKSSSPFIVDTTSGQHTVRVFADGYGMSEQQVLVQPGAVVAIAVELKETPATLTMIGASSGTVKIDGKHAAELPLRLPLEVAPGRALRVGHPQRPQALHHLARPRACRPA